MTKGATTISHLHSLHPHLITTLAINAASSPPSELTCALDIIYRLPPSVFVDRYQLNDTLPQFAVEGGEDLEAPLEHVDPQGTWLAVRLRDGQAMIDLPVHLRYQAPDALLTHRPIVVPAPKLGWSCQTAAMPPVLQTTLAFHSTTDHHPAMTWIPLSGSSDSVLELTVPVGNTKDATIVQWGTLAIIVLGTGWILQAFGHAVRKHRRHLAKGKRRKSE